MVQEINSKDEFETLVAERIEQEKMGKLIVLDCFATWCGPCRLIAPKITAFSEEYPHVDFYKLDVDKVADVASDLGVRAMPTFYFYKGGEKIDEVVGADSAAIKAKINQYASANVGEPVDTFDED
ncbi:putative thioredoxin [Pyronema omphalodes]|nr:putative thioredoxin [Pyronema omphalodes]